MIEHISIGIKSHLDNVYPPGLRLLKPRKPRIDIQIVNEKKKKRFYEIGDGEEEIN